MVVLFQDIAIDALTVALVRPGVGRAAAGHGGAVEIVATHQRTRLQPQFLNALM